MSAQASFEVEVFVLVTRGLNEQQFSSPVFNEDGV